MSAGSRSALRERASRHPGLRWLVLGVVFGVLAIVRWALGASGEASEADEFAGFAVLGYGTAALALLITGVAVEMRASTRRRRPDPSPEP